MKNNRNAIGSLIVLLSVVFIRTPVWCVATFLLFAADKAFDFAEWVNEWAPAFDRNDLK